MHSPLPTPHLNDFFRYQQIDEAYLSANAERFLFQRPRLRRRADPNNPSEEIITLTDPTPPEDLLGQWIFEVAVVTWDGKPYNPTLTWKPFRYWKTKPDDARLERAKEAALKTPRFFKMCSYCNELCNAGHMCEPTVCQSCAERHLGVVY